MASCSPVGQPCMGFTLWCALNTMVRASYHARAPMAKPPPPNLRAGQDLPHQGHSSLAVPRDKTGLVGGSHGATSQGRCNEFAHCYESELDLSGMESNHPSLDPSLR